MYYFIIDWRVLCIVTHSAENRFSFFTLIYCVIQKTASVEIFSISYSTKASSRNRPDTTVDGCVRIPAYDVIARDTIACDVVARGTITCDVIACDGINLKLSCYNLVYVWYVFVIFSPLIDLAYMWLSLIYREICVHCVKIEI